MKERLIHRKNFHPRTRLGRKLLKAIKIRGWTLSDLSKATRVSVPHLSRLIKGPGSTNTATLDKIARGLGVESGELL